MLWPETNRKVEKYFQHGILPTMVYINKQNYERQPVERPLHRHVSICELLLVYKGSGYYLLNGKRYYCEEGSVILYNQGDLHEMATDTDSEIGTYCIGIANLRIKDMPENCLLEPGEPCVRSSGDMFPLMSSICEEMHKLEGRGSDESLAVQLLCAVLIIMAGQLGAAVEKGRHFSKDINSEEHMAQRICKYLDEHYTESITLGMAARELGCSETYISHLFKRVTGQTPMQYVIRRRIGLAQTLLISTELSATQIASRVGYNSTNHFSTLFSRTVGMSPISYRRHYQAESKGLKTQL